jgi:hypothetical protein
MRAPDDAIQRRVVAQWDGWQLMISRRVWLLVVDQRLSRLAVDLCSNVDSDEREQQQQRQADVQRAS